MGALWERKRIGRREGLTRRDQRCDSCAFLRKEGTGEGRRRAKEGGPMAKEGRERGTTRSNKLANREENERDRGRRGETSAPVVDSCVCAE